MESVTDFAFIFHRSTILSGMHANSYGMKNAYFCRYQLFSQNTSSHTVSLYEREYHKPFAHLNSSYIPESTHHRIFQFITEMKRNADQVLWTQRKFANANGIGRTMKILINKECRDYFVAQLRKDSSYQNSDFYPKIARVQCTLFIMISALKQCHSRHNYTKLKQKLKIIFLAFGRFLVWDGATA